MFQRIKDLREDNDLTQADVAGILKMSQTGYSKYETGDNELPVSVLIRLSFLYNTSTDYLLGLTDINAPAFLNDAASERLEEYSRLLKQLKEQKARNKKQKNRRQQR